MPVCVSPAHSKCSDRSAYTLDTLRQEAKGKSTEYFYFVDHTAQNLIILSLTLVHSRKSTEVNGVTLG